jgi:hypothetical protein
MTLIDKPTAVFTVARADLMAAILADWGQGQIFLPHRPSAVLQDRPEVLLVADARDGEEPEWAALIDNVDTERRTVMVRDTLPLRTHVGDLATWDGTRFNERTKPLPGDFVFCNIQAVLDAMAKRRVSLAAVRRVHDATRADWKDALLAAGNKLTSAQQLMLRTHAQAPGLVADLEVLAQLAGLADGEEALKEYRRAGRNLARALGTGKLPAFSDILTIDTEVDEVDAYPDTTRMAQLRWPLAQAMLDAGWVERIGTPTVLPPPAGEHTSQLLIAAATREIEEDLDSRNESPTQREALVMARIGQGKFRERMFKLWEGRCALTDAGTAKALVASHALAWRSSDNRQRLDPYNGLLLAASVDRLFDEGLISFDDDGLLLAAESMTVSELQALGISPGARLRFVSPQHLPYLSGHRAAFGFKTMPAPPQAER